MGVQVFVLKPHETRTVFLLGTYAVGTHRFAVSAEATGLLSSIFAKTIPIGATVQLKHFYFVTGHGGAPDDRVDRESGTLLTNADAPTTDTVVVTRFHHTIQVEIVVTGAPCEFAVMVTPGPFTGGTGQDVNVTNPTLDVNLVNDPIDVNVVSAAESVATPLVTNVSIPLANTEVSVPLPNGCKRFLLKLRNNVDLKLSYTLGSSGTVFVTIPKGSVYTEGSVNPSSSITLYVQAPVASQVLELLTWT